MGDGDRANVPGRWMVISRETMADCRVFRVERLRSIPSPNAEDVQRGLDTAGWGLDGSHEPHDFYALNSPDFVNVVAITDDDKVVMVEQYRHGTGEVTLEVPGGLVDHGEDAIAAGVRELREETGYVGDHVEVLGVSRPNPAIQNNQLTTLLVRGAKLRGAQEQDAHEDCVVRTLPFAEVMAMVDDGRVDHALVLVALLRALRWRAARGESR